MELNVNNLTKRFGGIVALSNVSFDIKESVVVGLIGPNGAGKTTLFNLLTGFLKPDSGRIKFSGKSIIGMPSYKISSEMGISRTFQHSRPLNTLTVLENVMIGIFSKHSDKEYVKEEANKIVKFVKMEKYENVLAYNLTLLNKKRLELARALAMDPKLLLIDEVMAGLNSYEVEETLNLLREINSGKISLFLIEHKISVMMELAQKIIVLDHGEKIAEGTPNEIVNNENVIQSYLGSKKF
ncbi:MAG: ABC transporter ATP-binding protein [Promethearchaeota archaeon]